MIVPMKKIHVVARQQDDVALLEGLRDLGLLHVEHVRAPKGREVSKISEDVRVLEQVVHLLAHEHHLPQKELKKSGWRERAHVILGLAVLIDQQTEALGKRQIKIETWQPWGDFDLDDVELLRSHGLQVELVEVPQAELANVPEGIVLKEIFTEHKTARCVAVAREGIKLPFRVLGLPPVSLSDLKAAQEQARKRIKKAQEYLLGNNCYLDYFKNILSQKEQELTFQKVLAGGGSSEGLSFIKGFCPQDKVSLLQEAARRENWGLLVEDPDDQDDVPTLLRNPKWVELIKPVFGMINVLPGYHELDISAVFLVFFSIFFGILIGDAGYGLVFALATFFAQVKWGAQLKDKTPFFLMYVLSLCTIVWGVLTGTFFGQEWISGVFKPLSPWLADGYHVQSLCFFLGALHLSIAHCWRAVLKLPSLTALAEAGWLSLIWGMFFVARKLIIGAGMPGWAMNLFFVGPPLVVLFTKPNKNPLLAIGPGLGDLALNAINTFTDVVSYIRLFAVGLATVAVADAFNTMALGIGFNNIIAGIITALILVIGHLFNIILGAMAILVHGLRLNVLEFSNHLNLEWAGFRYHPLKKIEKNET